MGKKDADGTFWKRSDFYASSMAVTRQRLSFSTKPPSFFAVVAMHTAPITLQILAFRSQ
jgi:hypothetical protein